MPKDTALDKKITSILDESIDEDTTGVKAEVEELSEDVKEALGIDDNGYSIKVPIKKAKVEVTSLAPDLDYIPEDERAVLEEMYSIY